MKHLKDIVAESFFDDDIIDDPKHLEKTVKEEIKQFLKENYKGSSRCRISRKPNEDGKYVVDCKDDLSAKDIYLTRLTTDTFVFGEIEGTFNVSRTRRLTSLEGAPKKVRSFYCNDCTSLISLEGAPQEVVDFYCNSCKQLTSFKGAPEKVGGNFRASRCAGIKSAEGFPKEIGGDVDVSDSGFRTHNEVRSISKIGGKLKVLWNGNYL